MSTFSISFFFFIFKLFSSFIFIFLKLFIHLYSIFFICILFLAYETHHFFLLYFFIGMIFLVLHSKILHSNV
ncbi:hypothetical protein Lalb_Chr11g0067051 [Lupinus albus]|uniref:Uncharacterized protein n=1 Tax=Lupinus albus TaxID=3870 RepID=A0A6A4PRK7_LUPAL|nr:hypothetical protein Lalb_Chr11g0067051 [Lupinus albus]